MIKNILKSTLGCLFSYIPTTFSSHLKLDWDYLGTSRCVCVYMHACGQGCKVPRLYNMSPLQMDSTSKNIVFSFILFPFYFFFLIRNFYEGQNLAALSVFCGSLVLASPRSLLEIKLESKLLKKHFNNISRCFLFF